MAEEGTKKGQLKKKCPTALKRVKQTQECTLRNRSFKSRVRTAIRSFESALSEKDNAKMTTALSGVYSLMDKGVKRGIYNINKAARTKTQMALLQKSA